MQFFNVLATFCAMLFALLPTLSALPMIVNPASPNSKAQGFLSPYDFDSASDDAAILAAYAQYRPMQKKWTRLEPSIRFF
uniref:Secreted protein n=1 Tax=Steinernema glaseri TaxID=37863 RepID=A0A1I8ABV7_9BILA